MTKISGDRNLLSGIALRFTPSSCKRQGHSGRVSPRLFGGLENPIDLSDRPITRLDSHNFHNSRGILRLCRLRSTKQTSKHSHLHSGSEICRCRYAELMRETSQLHGLTGHSCLEILGRSPLSRIIPCVLVSGSANVTLHIRSSNMTASRLDHYSVATVSHDALATRRCAYLPCCVVGHDGLSLLVHDSNLLFSPNI